MKDGLFGRESEELGRTVAKQVSTSFSTTPVGKKYHDLGIKSYRFRFKRSGPKELRLTGTPSQASQDSFYKTTIATAARILEEHGYRVKKGLYY